MPLKPQRNLNASERQSKIYAEENKHQIPSIGIIFSCNDENLEFIFKENKVKLNTSIVRCFRILAKNNIPELKAFLVLKICSKHCNKENALTLVHKQMSYTHPE